MSLPLLRSHVRASVLSSLAFRDDDAAQRVVIMREVVLVGRELIRPKPVRRDVDVTIRAINPIADAQALARNIPSIRIIPTAFPG
jgi:hypothetical protein